MSTSTKNSLKTDLPTNGMCSLDTSMKVSTLVVVSWASKSLQKAKTPGVDTSHVGRSGTLGSQPSLEKGGVATEEMGSDHVHQIKRIKL